MQLCRFLCYDMLAYCTCSLLLVVVVQKHSFMSCCISFPIYHQVNDNAIHCMHGNGMHFSHVSALSWWYLGMIYDLVL